MSLKLLLMVCGLAASAQCYHILCIFDIPSRSHNHLGQGIVNALLEAGHEVTWVTPYPPKDSKKGLHVIDGSITRPIAENIDMTDQKNMNMGLAFVKQFASNISETTASIPALRQALLRGGFDAVCTEAFFSDVDAGYAAILQVPWILLSGVVMQPNLEVLVDEVRSVPVIPLLFNDFTVPMNFLQRVANVAFYNFMLLNDWWTRSETEERYERMFAPLAAARHLPLPPLQTALKNISILFLNSHPSFAPAQGLPPNVIEIGGYHITGTAPPLPKDLQELMDSSPGVVYFSLGSVLKSSALPAATKQALLKTLGELPYTVLWKFEEELKDLPKNVHIRPWMPQASILAHKNVKAFITHGGLLSNLETLRYGVPLVSIPVFGDQPANAARAARAGYALRVNYDTSTMADDLRDALKELLGNDKYYKQAKYLSSLFNKRPVPPADLIPHYVELAIESKGAYHLRSKATLYEWYQRWMLDILGALLLILYIVYRVIKKIIKTIAGKVTGNSAGKNKKNKMKKN